MEYVKDICMAVKLYNERVLPALRERNYGVALVELDGAINMLREALPRMPANTFNVYTLGLTARMRFLEYELKNALDPSKKVDDESVKRHMDLVEERLPIVELSANALKKQYKIEV